MKCYNETLCCNPHAATLFFLVGAPDPEEAFRFRPGAPVESLGLVLVFLAVFLRSSFSAASTSSFSFSTILIKVSQRLDSSYTHNLHHFLGSLKGGIRCFVKTLDHRLWLPYSSSRLGQWMSHLLPQGNKDNPSFSKTFSSPEEFVT